MLASPIIIVLVSIENKIGGKFIICILILLQIGVSRTIIVKKYI